MAGMSIRKKILIAIGSVLLAAFIGVSWMMWLIDGAFQYVVWENQSASLTLKHLPAKNISYFVVSESYEPGTTNVWTMTRPGASKRWVGAPTIPAAETVYSSAFTEVRESNLLGLISYYEDASPAQRLDIASHLEWKAETSDVMPMLKKRFEEGRAPWLQEVIQNASPMEN